ncbi:MAG: hypothetical protein ACR2JE_14195 [Acidobacteriaceae bacterium]
MIVVSARQALALSATILFSAAAGSAHAQTPSSFPKAERGYSISVFAKGVKGKYTSPDSLAVSNDRIYVGYGDGNDPAGLDGKANKIVEYTKTGRYVFSYNVIGHNDGLKVDPSTHKVWALQNEDGNPNLVIINPKTREQSVYTFAAPPPNGGGYDDIVFRNGEVYLSASNPAKNPNVKPAIVKARLVGNSVVVSTLLEGNAQATDVVTGAKVRLNLQDPDSMTLDPGGNVVMTSQSDSELVVVRKPSTKRQSVLQIPLSSPYGAPQVDDTLFTPSSDGFVLVSDTAADTIYAIRRATFAPGVAYSAAVAGSGGSAQRFVGRLDVEFGQLTPVVTGLNSPHGLAFVRTADDDDSTYEQLRDTCQRLFPND